MVFHLQFYRVNYFKWLSFILHPTKSMNIKFNSKDTTKAHLGGMVNIILKP